MVGTRGAEEAIALLATEGSQPAWRLRTARTSMVLSLAPAGALLLDHWGPGGQAAGPEPIRTAPSAPRPAPGAFLDGFPLAFPVYGDPVFKEPCLSVVYHDGTRAARLAYAGAAQREIEGRPGLELTFSDPAYGLRVTHYFALFEEHDLVARWVTLENTGAQPLTVERLLSAALPLPPGEYEAWTLHGTWGREFQLTRRPLLQGKVVVESRRGFTSHEANPWFALGAAGSVNEERGEVWFGALAWSGSWYAAFEVEHNQALSVLAGLQPFDFAWRLEPGERLAAPKLLCGYTREGLGGTSRLLHAFEAAEVLPVAHRDTPRPVLYNSWEATAFDVTAKGQMALARRAADLGVELFVVDDGWFGARDHDRAGLGDWQVNRRKFPYGLDELIAEVNRLGMRFGLWVEPEMVNPDSDLYRAHPDWVLRFERHEPAQWRSQLVLNFARKEVRAHILDQLRALLCEHRIAFLKWDHNRPISDAGWPQAPLERQREVWVRHVRGVYDVLAQLRAEFPSLLIESCASGGGRADLGILRLTDQVWVSDNTDAADRLRIQYGYSHAYAPRTMVSWVTDSPNQQTGRTSPLDFRFHVAMQGVLGIGGDIQQWSEAELARARELVAEYRRLRPTLQHGTQHWLQPPGDVGPCAVQYVAPDRSQCVLLLYQVRGAIAHGARQVRLRGLDRDRLYCRASDGLERGGGALMDEGLRLIPAEWEGHGLDWRSQVQVWEDAGK